MPQALKGIDWGLVKALYFKGANPEELSNQFGIKACTVYQRIKRGNWAVDRQAAQMTIGQAQVQAVIQEQSEPDIDLISRRVRRTLARVVEKTADSLSRENPSDAKGKAARLQSLDKLAQVSKTVFAWGSDNVKVSLNLSLLGQATSSQFAQPIDIKGDTKSVSHNIDYLQLPPTTNGQAADNQVVSSGLDPASGA